MHETSGVMPRYMKIDQVVLNFSDQVNGRNTLHLHMQSSAVNWHYPVFAMLTYVGELGQRTILPEVRLEVWESDDRLAPIIATSKAEGRLALTADVTFVTQFAREEGLSQLMGVGYLNALLVLEKINEFAWMQRVGFRPAWYTDDLHGLAFDHDNGYTLVGYDHQEVADFYVHPSFVRGVEADRVLQQLEEIPLGHEGAARFHDWVVLALATIFADDLERVRKHPNPRAAEQRDIVATNTRRNRFWQRLASEYGVGMPVFEVKNYPEPDGDDFGRVYAYLGHEHYGRVGFIVARADGTTKLPAVMLRQFREMYRKDGIGKLIIVVPSALLAEFLVDIQYGRAGQVDGKMAQWLEDYLLKHLNEPPPKELGQPEQGPGVAVS